MCAQCYGYFDMVLLLLYFSYVTNAVVLPVIIIYFLLIGVKILRFCLLWMSKHLAIIASLPSPISFSSIHISQKCCLLRGLLNGLSDVSSVMLLTCSSHALIQDMPHRELALFQWSICELSNVKW